MSINVHIFSYSSVLIPVCISVCVLQKKYWGKIRDNISKLNRFRAIAARIFHVLSVDKVHIPNISKLNLPLCSNGKA